MKGLQSIYAARIPVGQSGVMLLDLVPDTYVQGALDWDEPTAEQRDRSKLMHAMYRVNERFGKRTVLLGSSGLSQGADTWGDASDPQNTQLHDAVE